MQSIIIHAFVLLLNYVFVNVISRLVSFPTVSILYVHIYDSASHSSTTLLFHKCVCWPLTSAKHLGFPSYLYYSEGHSPSRNSLLLYIYVSVKGFPIRDFQYCYYDESRHGGSCIIVIIHSVIGIPLFVLLLHTCTCSSTNCFNLLNC